MKYLPPLLGIVVVFFAARYLRPIVVTPGHGPSGEVSQRVEKRGLSQKIVQLAEREDSSIAALERAQRAGKLSFWQLYSAVQQAAAKDPGGTMDWIESADLDPNTKSNLRAAVIGVWFPKDPQAALARMSTAPYLEATEMAGPLLALLTQGTPAQAAAVKAHLGELMDLVGAITPFMGLPPLTAEGGEVLMALPEGRGRDATVQMFAQSWLESDASAAVAWLARLPPGQRSGIMETFAARALHPMGSAKPADQAIARDWFLKEASPATRSRLGPVFAESLAKSDPSAAMTWATENLASSPLAVATGKIVARMVASKPGEARQWVEALPPGDQRHRAAYHVAEAWLAEDPAAAIGWWLGQVDRQEASKSGSIGAAERLGSQWFKEDPDSFRSFVADPASSALPFSLLFPGVQAMMEGDKAAAFEWIGTLPEKRRGDVAKAAYQSWAYDAPAEAAAGYDARPDLATGDAARQIATNWYERDPQAALGWISNLPWGGPREAALVGVKKIADFEVELGGTFPEDLKKLVR